jgi:hypothetical protein
MTTEEFVAKQTKEAHELEAQQKKDLTAERVKLYGEVKGLEIPKNHSKDDEEEVFSIFNNFNVNF